VSNNPERQASLHLLQERMGPSAGKLNLYFVEKARDNKHTILLYFSAIYEYISAPYCLCLALTSGKLVKEV
jgi:hypothetical protein